MLISRYHVGVERSQSLRQLELTIAGLCQGKGG
jgi:hypothetical protein